ncbi:MAG: hypothetical protein AAGA37_19890 [Actinomycetota bacterium]
MTRDLRPDDFAVTAAIARNIVRYCERQSQLLMSRRGNDWTDDGITATNPDPGRAGTGPAKGPLYTALTDTVLQGGSMLTGIDYRAAILDPQPLLIQLEKALAELSRPTKAELEERETTHTRDSLTKPAGSGTCAATGKYCDGTTDRIVTQSGVPLCRSQHNRWKEFKNKHAWATGEDYVAYFKGGGAGGTADPALTVTATSLIATWETR